MGFGVPAAIGVKVARPDRTVVDIAGDGSFMMTCNQIATAVQYNIPICVLIMNDYCLGMVHQLQDVFYGKRYQAVNFDRSINYAKLAESMGAVGIRVTEEKEIKSAIQKGLSCGKPSVIDFVLEDNSNVYPMVTGSTLLEYKE
jgi:acetolactate synthase-1/2/3 large subunit